MDNLNVLQIVKSVNLEIVNNVKKIILFLIINVNQFART